MSTIIQVLEQMGSDATLNNEHDITELLANADISDCQQQAILTKDSEQLAETITDLPKIKCFLVVPAEDDDQQEEKEQEEQGSETSNQQAIKVVVNF